jgi:hypothetical protein
MNPPFFFSGSGGGTAAGALGDTIDPEGRAATTAGVILNVAEAICVFPE